MKLFASFCGPEPAEAGVVDCGAAALAMVLGYWGFAAEWAAARQVTLIVFPRDVRRASAPLSPSN
jgi:hypothetical protein